MERAGTQAGFTTIQYVAVVAFSLLLLVLVANLTVNQYARGVIRDALSEGARAGAAAGAGPAECAARANDVMDGLLRGPVGDGVGVSCRREGDLIVARAEGRLPSWLPMLVPHWRVSHLATMQVEL